jgi:stress response protein SCP2
LEQAVKNSLKKGYHSRDTVFQNVMKSGVSKILLKGETYSAAPNLSRIQMIESWRYDGDTIFLDASCLVYGFKGELLNTVDYSHTTASTRSPSGHHTNVYIQHSGDLIDHEQRMGQHSIHIDISLIPSSVAALFFTVSAWTTTLKEIYQPSAQLYDSVSDTEMCRYKLEDQDTGDKTAVIMCKLHRPSPGGRWQLTSIGHVGYGRAGTYLPIHHDIQNYL